MLTDTCETLDVMWQVQNGQMTLTPNSTLTSTNVSQCQEACLTSDLCSSFTFDPATDECQVFTEDRRQSPLSFQAGGLTLYYEWRCQNSKLQISV